MTTDYSTPGVIRAAVQQLTARQGWRADRLEAIARLLVRGGWTHVGDRVQFADGAVTSHHHCTCQQGTAIECLHKIAVREVLPLAARLAMPNREVWPPPFHQRACVVRAAGLTLWRWRSH